MSNFKAIGIIFIKRQLRAKGPDIEKKFLDQLSPEEEEMFSSCLAFTWLPVEKSAKFFDVAARLLYPGSGGLTRVGKELAKDNLGGAFKFLVMIATIPYVVKQAARFWNAYHDRGLATVIMGQGKDLQFIVERYPDLPDQFRDLVQGFIEAIIELAGGKMVNVSRGERIENGCKWHVSWS